MKPVHRYKTKITHYRKSNNKKYVGVRKTRRRKSGRKKSRHGKIRRKKSMRGGGARARALAALRSLRGPAASRAQPRAAPAAAGAQEEADADVAAAVQQQQQAAAAAADQQQQAVGGDQRWYYTKGQEGATAAAEQQKAAAEKERLRALWEQQRRQQLPGDKLMEMQRDAVTISRYNWLKQMIQHDPAYKKEWFLGRESPGGPTRQEVLEAREVALAKAKQEKAQQWRRRQYERQLERDEKRRAQAAVNAAIAWRMERARDREDPAYNVNQHMNELRQRNADRYRWRYEGGGEA